MVHFIRFYFFQWGYSCVYSASVWNKNSQCSWGNRHSFVHTLCKDDCPRAALWGTGETVALPSYLNRTAFLTGQPADLSPTSRHRQICEVEQNEYRQMYTALWKSLQLRNEYLKENQQFESLVWARTLLWGLLTRHIPCRTCSLSYSGQHTVWVLCTGPQLNVLWWLPSWPVWKT